jgi:hypothetical protein
VTSLRSKTTKFPLLDLPLQAKPVQAMRLSPNGAWKFPGASNNTARDAATYAATILSLDFRSACRLAFVKVTPPGFITKRMNKHASTGAPGRRSAKGKPNAWRFVFSPNSIS